MRWHIVWYVVNAFFCIFVEVSDIYKRNEK